MTPDKEQALRQETEAFLKHKKFRVRDVNLAEPPGGTFKAVHASDVKDLMVAFALSPTVSAYHQKGMGSKSAEEILSPYIETVYKSNGIQRQMVSEERALKAINEALQFQVKGETKSGEEEIKRLEFRLAEAENDVLNASYENGRLQSRINELEERLKNK